jgi:2-dehydropantoate 2-reductase
MTCVAFIANECIQVAHAQDICLAEMQGHDFEFFAFDSPDEIPSKVPRYIEIWQHHALLKASMLQDLEKGRDTEIDYINGVICRKGDEFGVSTPFNDRVVELVKEAQSSRTVNDFSLISRFDDLITKHAPGVTFQL